LLYREARVLNHPQLTLRGIRATAINVPMNYTLGTSAQIVREAPLLLVDIETEEGVTGHAYQFCYTPKAAGAIQIFLDDALSAIKGARVDPQAIWQALAKRYTLIGVQGIVRMAMAMIDVACWDAVAKASGLPLAKYLGATPRPMPAYNSCGLGLMVPQAVADEAEKLLAERSGFRAVKLRLGYATLEEDLAATRAVRNRVADSVMIMTDFNQALSAEEALKRGHALDDEGIYWIEEPVRHDDYAASAQLAAEIATPVQIGENRRCTTWKNQWRRTPAILSCPIWSASAALPAGCARRKRRARRASKCRRICIPK
jgi:mandelate racemase